MNRTIVHKIPPMQFYYHRSAAWILICASLVVVGQTTVRAQYRESFEAPETTWKLADRDCSVRVLRQERSFTQAHSGQASELLQMQVGQGTYVHWTYELPPSRVIDEWNTSLWIKSDQAGVQLLARVVLPRSTDPRTGGPLKTLLPGTTYRQTGTWQQLVIQSPAKLLLSQLPKLRAQFGSQTSDREAYIDLLVLNTYGGPGPITVSIDDLEVNGLVDVGTSRRPSPTDPVFRSEPVGGRSGSPTQRRTRLDGSALIIDGNTRLVRAIQYQGEPLARLKELGFNAVWCAVPPSDELVRTAEQTGMFLIAPPQVDGLPGTDARLSDALLCWDLDAPAGMGDIERLRRMAQRLRGLPERARRPLIDTGRGELWQISRIVDILVLPGPEMNGSMPLADAGAAYRYSLQQTRLDTTFWATIPTQLAPDICRQIHAIGAEMPVPLSLEPDQIRLATYHAIASGAHGLLFASRSRLDAPDRLTGLRAKTLQWVNQELDLVEPWAAAGSYDGEVETGNPNLRVTTLKAPRSRMLVIIRRAPQQQYVVGPVDNTPASFEIYGVPESDEVYRVTPHGMIRLAQQRAAGLRIALDAQQLVALVVVTQDPLAINFLAQKIDETRRTQDQLLGEIAFDMYASVAETRQRLLDIDPAGVAAGDALDTARRELQHFQRLVEDGGHDQAYPFLRQGLQQLAAIRYADWAQAVQSFPAPVASPLCVSYFLIPEHYALGQRLRSVNWSPNSLVGGDFENLALLQSGGWINEQSAHDNCQTTVQLSLRNPHGGRSALALTCTPKDPLSTTRAASSPPVRVISAATPIQSGQLVRIHGWIRVDQPITGSLDGFVVRDSLGGPALCQRIYQTRGWQEFTLFRAAAHAKEAQVTFELTGYGEAQLDDVTISTLQPPGS